MQLITPADAAGRVATALKSAAQATGAGFDYLLRTAKRESSLNPTAQAPTSSARGLFQFIDQTWLETLKEAGPQLGLANEAADVTRTASGRYTVADPARKAELLALRDDPQTAALLAGAFTQRNAATFSSAIGRAPTEGELYVAHFLGAQGAVQLTSLAANNPDVSAAAAFPSQASANRAIFYDKGRPRTALEVYSRLTATPSAGEAPVLTASTAATPAVTGTTRVALAMQSRQADIDYGPFNGGVEDDKQAFHSMFKTGRRSPVSGYVQQAWSSFGSAGLTSDTVATAKTASVTASPAMAAAYYAPKNVAATAPAAAAVAAVEAAGKRSDAPALRRVSLSTEIAAVPAATTTAPAATADAAPVKTATREPFDLGKFLGIDLSFLTSSASANAQAQARRGARP